MRYWAFLYGVWLFAVISVAENKMHDMYPYQESRLSNGLRVITLEDFSCPIVAVQVWYHVGSKDERPDRQGFAHMFEHMMFRGTDLLGPEGHFELIRRTGGYANAFTSFDYTAYVNLVPANQLELALWLEAERMMYLKIDEANFQTERQVVIEERRQDLNEPYGTVFEQIMPAVFTVHPYRWLPIGQIEALQAANAEELKAFWNTFYVPGNAVLVIVGAVKHSAALRAAEKYFGWIPALPEPPKTQVNEPEQTEPRDLTIEEGTGPAPLIRLVYRTVPEKDPDYIPLRIATEILGGGESSRIYQDLVKRRKLCQDASAYLYALEQAGLVLVGADLAPGGDLEPVLHALETHVSNLATQGVTERELEKAKNQLKRNVITDSLTVMDKARQIGQATIVHGSPDWLNQQLERIASVTREDIQQVTAKYFRAERCTRVRIVPKPGAVYTPATLSPPSEIPDWHIVKDGIMRPATYPTTPPMKELSEDLPRARILRRTLPNGLRVILVPNNEAPFVTMMLGIKEGAWTEPPDKPGVASAALEMITQGTEHYSAEELAELLDFNAITLRGSAEANGRPTMDVGQVLATALSEKFPLAMELLSEVVRRPTFPEGELSILREQRRMNLAVKEKDPRYIADCFIYRKLYQDHPYARQTSGTLADVDRLTPEALREWWKKHVRPDDTSLYIAGDVKPEQAWELARKYFGDWKTVPSESPSSFSVPQRSPLHIWLVDVPDAVQSQIRVGQTTITRGHPEYHNARVFSQIFGTDFNSRLNRVLRIERGLTYSVWGMFIPQRDSGEFMCSTFTQTESTSEAVQELLRVIDGMRTSPPNLEELDSAKASLVGGFAKQLETPRDFLEYQWMMEYNGLPNNYLKKALHAYKSATVDDMVRVASTLVDRDTLQVVVVGNAEKTKEGLERIAPVTVVPSGSQTE